MALVFYNSLHVVGALLVFIGFGVLIARAMLGSDDARLRKFGGIVSGVGLFLLLVSGFGQLAKAGHSYTSWWMLVKFALFLGLGAMTALINRMPHLAGVWFWVTVAIGAIAATLGLTYGNLSALLPG